MSRSTLPGVTVDPAGVILVMKAIAADNGTTLSEEVEAACKAYITSQATAKSWTQASHPAFPGYDSASAEGLLPAA